MLTKLIEFSLANRFLIVVLVMVVIITGAVNALRIPIDAVPDMTNTQVQVITNCGSLSPVEVERYVTYPVEMTFSGLPNVEEVRSISRLGLSVVTIVFTEGTDIHRARTWVSERLPSAQNSVAQYGSPEIGAMTTALGEILQFEVKGPGYSLMDLRTILEWTIAPELRRVPGVTEVNSHGGYYKSYEVAIDAQRLADHQLTVQDVFEAVANNNLNAGGGYIVHAGQQRFVRGEARVKSLDELGQIVVRRNASGLPILIHDVADVRPGALPRQGVVTRDGKGEIVTGMVMMLRGENSRTVVRRAREKLESLAPFLPPGVRTEVIYDRSHLIDRTLHTVEKNLVEGGLLVIAILFLTLGNFRAGLIVALVIPLSMMFATNLMYASAISASLMSLGAIDFGLVVDSSVIMVENCIRRLAERTSQLGRGTWLSAVERMQVIRSAALEVRKPTMFGELIIAIVYVPILMLQGTEGKLFRPMALTVLFALIGSMILSLTLMPVLAYWALPRKPVEKDVWLLRVIQSIYQPILFWCTRNPWTTVMAALALMLASIPIGWRLGAEFMPKLDEGDLLVEAVRLPSASLEDAVVRSTEIENVLVSFPEVKTVFCKTGRPEIANDVMGVHQTDVWVILNPVEAWPDPDKSRDELIEEMSLQLTRAVPGVAFGFTQPIEMRVDELVAGVKSDVAVLVHGDDLETLAKLSGQIESVLAGVPGAVDVKAELQDSIRSYTVRPIPSELAAHGLAASDVMKAIAAAGGEHVGEVFKGRARFPIVVKWKGAGEMDPAELKQLIVGYQDGFPITLSKVADIVVESTPPGVEHENGQRRTFIAANVRGRDVASFVADARQQVLDRVQLPAGYFVEWGGDFEHLLSASRRLAIITPIVFFMVAMLLYSTFGSFRLAALIFCAVPIAATGGVFALAARGMPFSISAGVGFIALFGVAVLNGLVWVSAAEKRRLDGEAPREAARQAAIRRLRPILMTASVASFGFLPMALSTSAGSEIQRPLATVVIGGLVTATALTALVVPAVYPWFCGNSSPQSQTEELAS